MKLADYKATLQFSNGQPPVEMPVYQSNIGPDVIDIRKLYGQTGMFTYDPGFLSTASCQSAITFIDGDKGELLYRGYPIEQLATNCDFLETCHLLLYGELPNAQRKHEFTQTVTHHTMVHEQLQFFLRGSVVMPTPWPCSPAWWALYRPSTMTAPTSTTQNTVKWRPFV